MADDKEENEMALRQEEILKTRKAAEAKKRKELIRSIANEVCDRNDKALRRLAKS